MRSLEIDNFKEAVLRDKKLTYIIIGYKSQEQAWNGTRVCAPVIRRDIERAVFEKTAGRESR